VLHTDTGNWLLDISADQTEYLGNQQSPVHIITVLQHHYLSVKTIGNTNPNAFNNTLHHKTTLAWLTITFTAWLPNNNYAPGLKADVAG